MKQRPTYPAALPSPSVCTLSDERRRRDILNATGRENDISGIDAVRLSGERSQFDAGCAPRILIRQDLGDIGMMEDSDVPGA